MNQEVPAEVQAFREKLLSIGYLSRGRTGNRVKEGRRADGVRVKAVTDELGNTVTEHAQGDRQDVHIRVTEPIRAHVEELRQ